MSKKEQFIRDRQAEFRNVSKMQEWIDEGIVWSMEGAIGREAMRGLESGKYFLPNETYNDYYGNHIPSRDEVRIGTAGSLDNAYDFYQDDNNLWELELQYEEHE